MARGLPQWREREWLPAAPVPRRRPAIRGRSHATRPAARPGSRGDLPAAGQGTLEALAREPRALGPPQSRRVHTAVRASYGFYYRRMMPRLLAALDFRSTSDPFAEGQTGYQSQPLDEKAKVPLILVVDDGCEIAEMAREALAETGYRVVVAHSAEEAIQVFDEAAAASDAFDLVFSDVLMPSGANGLVLAGQVRERSPTTPVILTTGYNDQMSLDRPQAVAMEVLGKPYKRTELIDRIQAGLRQGARIGPGRNTSDFGHAQA